MKLPRLRNLRRALARLGSTAAVLALATPATAAPTPEELVTRSAGKDALERSLARYAPAEVEADVKSLAEGVRGMIPHLLAAADQIDAIFWRQVSEEGRSTHDALTRSKAPGAKSLAKLYAINFGPWDRHDDDRPLVRGRTRPAGANLYPTDLTRRELDAWLETHPADAYLFTSPYTVIRRDNGALRAIPYSVAYASELQATAYALRQAASAYTCTTAPCPCEGLAQFLGQRADGLLKDDYRPSEMTWVGARTCPIDVAIGPYEYYEDRLLGQKTGFGSILSVRDDAESKRFESLAGEAQALIAALPVSDVTRARLQPIPQTPITVADLIHSAGDARAGFQIRAYVLPNDEVVRLARGQKHVVLRNMVEAKFEKLVKPVASQLLSAADAEHVTFETYFDHLMAWQLSHGVVSGPIALPDGTTSTSQALLADRHLAMDALKGEALALWNYLQLAGRGKVADADGKRLAATLLVTLFQQAREASDSPQSIARIITWNYLVQQGVYVYQPATGTYETRPEALREAVRKLATEVLEVIARGDYDGAGRLIVQHAIIAADMREKVATLEALPIEILPQFTSADALRVKAQKAER